MPDFLSNFNVLLLGVATLLLLGVLASKASYKLGVPALLLFLVIGMLAGSEGIGGVDFTDYGAAQALGTLALAYILFAGGLDTYWESIRGLLLPGAALATIGVILTGAIVGFTAFWAFDLTLVEGLLLGAIVSSTDAAAVFAVLRSRSVRLQPHLKALLELESGSNDPMAILLTIGLISVITRPEVGPASLATFFALQMIVGGAIGLGIGRLLPAVLNRVHLEYDGLYTVLTLGTVVFIYSAAGALSGNGFLAVYLAGLMMGKSDFVHKRSLTRFHDGVAWLMQIAMFVTLGLLVFPSQLVPIAAASLAVAFVLVLVARPVATFLTLIPFKMALNEKLFVSWVGLKGAVPIVLATFPLLGGVPEANLIFNAVFFVVLTSVLIQGTSIPLVARWLKVEDTTAPVALALEPEVPWEPPSISSETGHQREIYLEPGSPAAGKQIVNVRFPPNALVIALHRDGRTMVPTGGTVLHPGDILVMLVEDEALPAVQELLGSREPVSSPADA